MLTPIFLEIEEFPHFTHHRVQAYMSDGVKVLEDHIHLIASAIDFAEELEVTEEPEWRWTGKTWSKC